MDKIIITNTVRTYCPSDTLIENKLEVLDAAPPGIRIGPTCGGEAIERIARRRQHVRLAAQCDVVDGFVERRMTLQHPAFDLP